MTSSNRGIRIVVLLALAGVLAAVQLFLKEPESTLLWEALFNSGHAPLYGVLSLVVLGLLDTIRPSWRRGRRYLEAFWITFFAGAVMELLQRFGPREPQIADLLRNAAGIAAFLGIAAGLDASFLYEGSRNRVAKRIALWIGAAGALGFALLPVILAGGAVLARDNRFPVLYGFDTVWERQHVFASENAEVEFRRRPGNVLRDGDDFEAYVTFKPGRYSVLTLYDPHPDWTGYDRLTFSAFSELEDTAKVGLWIIDDDHAAGSEDSFRRRLEIEPGENHIEIPLSEIRAAANQRELDMTRIHRMVIYGTRVQSPFSLSFDDFRLE